MDSIKHSIDELTQHFNLQMAEFQKSLINVNNTASPTTNITAQFNTFRSFVLNALEGLQLQVQLLTKQYDNMEMRSRRKILLVHGVAEERNEDTASQVIQVLANHLKVSDFCADDISRCQRLGKISSGKSRPILVKFRDQSLRNQLWYSKSSLKSTGITLSEFLTKARHETFMIARQRFGISKCWTKDGFVIVIGPDGKRHTIVLSAELDRICTNLEPRSQGTCAPTTIKSAAAAKPTVRTTRKVVKK